MFEKIENLISAYCFGVLQTFLNAIERVHPVLALGGPLLVMAGVQWLFPRWVSLALVGVVWLPATVALVALLVVCWAYSRLDRR
jgi:hypothetical protein